MSQLFKINDKKEAVAIAYKLLHDLLFLLLLFLAASLLAEGILPGIISSHIGISKIVVLIAGTIFLISLGSPFVPLATKGEKKKSSGKILFSLAFFGVVLLLNGMIRISFALNLAITVLAASAAYVIYAIIIKEK